MKGDFRLYLYVYICVAEMESYSFDFEGWPEKWQAIFVDSAVPRFKSTLLSISATRMYIPDTILCTYMYCISTSISHKSISTHVRAAETKKTEFYSWVEKWNLVRDAIAKSPEVP